MRKKKALFLDRDGVINVDHPYVHSREEFHFQAGIFELCRAAQALFSFGSNHQSIRHCARLLFGVGFYATDGVDAGQVH